jgi:hypothetical protein
MYIIAYVKFTIAFWMRTSCTYPYHAVIGVLLRGNFSLWTDGVPIYYHMGLTITWKTSPPRVWIYGIVVPIDGTIHAIFMCKKFVSLGSYGSRFMKTEGALTSRNIDSWIIINSVTAITSSGWCHFDFIRWLLVIRIWRSSLTLVRRVLQEEGWSHFPYIRRFHKR